MSREFKIDEWYVRTHKGPISNAPSIEALQTAVEIPIPEMIFGENLVSVSYRNEEIIRFDAEGALDNVDKTGTELKVKYSAHWNASRLGHEEIKQVTKPYDWTYSTTYRGSSGLVNETQDEIPLELLRRPDPILFYDDVLLYESELDDNGISCYSVKVRVMPERLLILARLFMRLDGVVFRIRDTRVYIEFRTGVVLREYSELEGQWDEVNAGDRINDIAWISQNLKTVKVVRDRLR